LGKNNPFLPLSEAASLLVALGYSVSNNGVTLKSGLGVIQGHWKWHHSIDHIRVLIGIP